MNRLLVVFAAGAFLTSCANNNEEAVIQESVMSNTQKHAILKAEIDSLENAFYNSDLKLDDATSTHLMKAYIEFSTIFVADKKLSPEYLYKAAALARANKIPVKALKYYGQIESEYPDYIKNSEVAFLIGFTYDEDLNRPDQAKEAYQAVVDKYPGDIWAIQSEERLKTIDMTDEELIEFFKKKNNIE